MTARQPRHHGVLLVDKEQGWTSHDVVARVRRLFGQKKVGHTGTLDPMATGLLVVCLGKATRLVEYMVGHGKEYTGAIRLGVSTETDDAEGAVLERRDVPVLSAADVEGLRGRFTGAMQQVPPQYSAVKTEGQRAYAVARGGGLSELAARPVTVHALELELREPDLLIARVECSAGTYIRALARDIGEDLGCGAHLVELRRTRVGGFRVEDARNLAAIEDVPEEDRGGLLLPPGAGMDDMPRMTVGPDEARRLVVGMPVPRGCDDAEESPFLVFSEGGLLIGVGRRAEPGMVRCSKVFAGVDEIQSG